ncbi:SRPBCC family protein [Actinoplanes sp. N902-109]|uniref:SRPBCC family protein n=1 Tax=Actinoplanes sp. (strain N902-109) TaxID=649831 RepID=UPI00032947A5|nr:SRPBCC family protein [Actinoplanes sp. N902-109]AGL17550.1 cyclase/dehydrase [Actinoplanes sp. N902-109]
MLIEVVTDIDAPRTVVFDLELDMDVHAASLATSAEQATTSTGRPRLGPGDEVTFRARHLGLTWHMTTRISAHDRPRRFVDEQTRGPFRTLHHEHLFTALSPARTRMTDRMTVTAPLGPLGHLVTRLLLAPYLRRLLHQRGAHIKHLAEHPGSRPDQPVHPA